MIKRGKVREGTDSLQKVYNPRLKSRQKSIFRSIYNVLENKIVHFCIMFCIKYKTHYKIFLCIIEFDVRRDLIGPSISYLMPWNLKNLKYI